MGEMSPRKQELLIVTDNSRLTQVENDGNMESTNKSQQGGIQMDTAKGTEIVNEETETKEGAEPLVDAINEPHIENNEPNDDDAPVMMEKFGIEEEELEQVKVKLPEIPDCGICLIPKEDAVVRSAVDIKHFPHWEGKLVCDECRQKAHLEQAREANKQKAEDMAASDAEQYAKGMRWRYEYRLVSEDGTEDQTVIQYNKVKLQKKQVKQHCDRLVKIHKESGFVAAEMKQEVKLSAPPKKDVSKPTDENNKLPVSSSRQAKPYVPNKEEDERKRSMGYPHKYVFKIDNIYKDQYAATVLKETTIQTLKKSYARIYKAQNEITVEYFDLNKEEVTA